MNLTKRQTQIVALLAEGNTADQCAAALHRSVGTVRRHVVLACSRVNARNVAHLVAKSLSNGWISPVPALVAALLITMAACGDDQLRNTARLRIQRTQQQLRREV